MEGTLRTLVIATALGCGLVSGVFFAFSTFVMRGLDRLPARQGIAAMQSINVTAVGPLFMIALFGTAALCLAVGIWALTRVGQPYAPYLIGAAALYLAGVVVLTGGYHVPRNDALAELKVSAPDAAARWRDYVQGWTAWNHVRTVAPLLSSGLLIVALAV